MFGSIVTFGKLLFILDVMILQTWRLARKTPDVRRDASFGDFPVFSWPTSTDWQSMGSAALLIINISLTHFNINQLLIVSNLQLPTEPPGFYLFAVSALVHSFCNSFSLSIGSNINSELEFPLFHRIYNDLTFARTRKKAWKSKHWVVVEKQTKVNLFRIGDDISQTQVIGVWNTKSRAKTSSSAFIVVTY